MKPFGDLAGDGPVKDLVSLITQRNAQLQETQQRMTRLRGTGRSADERVRVEVDRFGALTDLRIDPRAMRLGSEALTQAILDAAEQGVRDARAQADEMMRPLLDELAAATPGDPGGAAFAGQEMDDLLAALGDLRRSL
jgi:DNA-binding protein YbaB